MSRNIKDCYLAVVNQKRIGQVRLSKVIFSQLFSSIESTLLKI
jgi:hypothetical protein